MNVRERVEALYAIEIISGLRPDMLTLDGAGVRAEKLTIIRGILASLEDDPFAGKNREGPGLNAKDPIRKPYQKKEAAPPKVHEPPPFLDLLPLEVSAERVGEYVAWAAVQEGCPIEEIEKSGSGNMEAFVVNFRRWEKAQAASIDIQAIIASFLDLKAKGFTAFVGALTVPEFEGWPVPVKDKFIWKINRARAAGIDVQWPPAEVPPEPSQEPQEEVPTPDLPSPPTPENDERLDPLSEKGFIFGQAQSLRQVNRDLYTQAVESVGCGFAAAAWTMDNLRAVSAVMDKLVADQDEKEK